MNSVHFEFANGTTLDPYVDYGVILKTWEAQPPAPKTNLVSLDGRDGDLDYTEWAGVIRYESREVTVSLRDMTGHRDAILAALLGQRVSFYFDDDPHWIYSGRCTAASTQSQHRFGVCDIDLTFACDPYRMKDALTWVFQSLISTEVTVTLTPKRKPVIPTIVVTGGPLNLRIGEDTTELEAGEYTLATLVLTGPTEVGVSGSGTVLFKWTDGDF